MHGASKKIVHLKVWPNGSSDDIGHKEELNCKKWPINGKDMEIKHREEHNEIHHDLEQYM